MMEWNYNLILHQTSVTRVKFKQYINVRPVRSGTTQYPFHAFNKQRSTQSCHRHCSSAFGQHIRRVILRLHNTFGTNHTFKFKRTPSNEYKRTNCLPRVNTTPVHQLIYSTNKDRSTQSCHCDCSVFGQHDGTWGWDYDLILHRTPITPSSSSAQAEI